MGFKLAARVYEEVKETSGIAQTVLAYLAFRASDETGACFPSRDTIISCTHHSESAVKRALNELRNLKVLNWVPGGRKKGGGGKSIANSYFFNFSGAVDNFSGAVDNFSGAVDNFSGAVDQSEAGGLTGPLQGFTETPCSGSNRPPIIINQKKNKPVATGGENSSVGEDSSVLDERMASAKLGMKWRQKNAHPNTGAQIKELGLVERAMRACHVNDLDNRRVFSSIMIYKDPMSCRETITAFESECHNGENKNIKKSLAAILTHRLKKLADIDKK